MEFRARILSLAGGLEESIVCLAVKGKYILSSLEKLQGKELNVNVKKPSKKRSLDSNSYFWVLCEKIAEEVGTDKDSVYLEMLERYGKFTHAIVRPEAVDAFRKNWKASRIIGDVMVNGDIGVQLQLYYGSSTYDQKEMCRLINGIVNECKDLGIETMTPDEIAAMNAGWAV